MSYSNARSAMYRFPAVNVSSAAVLGRIQGPAGAEGRLISIAAVVTTNVTANPAVIAVGNSGDADAQGTLSIPVSAAGSGVNTLVRGVDNRIDADSIVEVSSDGGSTAGAADLLVLIDWYGGDAS